MLYTLQSSIAGTLVLQFTRPPHNEQMFRRLTKTSLQPQLLGKQFLKVPLVVYCNTAAIICLQYKSAYRKLIAEIILPRGSLAQCYTGKTQIRSNGQTSIMNETGCMVTKITYIGTWTFLKYRNNT